MQTYLKSRPAGIQLLLFLGMSMAAFMIIFFTGGLILSKITGISLVNFGNYRSWTSGDPNVVMMLRGTFFLQFLGLFLVPSLFFGYFSDPKPAEYLGLRKPLNSLYWVLAIVVMIVAVPFVEYTGIINRELLIHSSMMKSIIEMEESANRAILVVLEKHTPGNLLINLVFIALFAGVGEELFFRGILQRLIIRMTRSPWAGILISAFLFSFFHFQFLGFLPRLILGTLLGASYWYSRSLWTVILAHFLYDGLFIVLAYFYPQTAASDATLFENKAALIPITLISAGLLVFLLWTMKRRSNADFRATYQEELEAPRPDNDLSF
jgi:membrane protease YdiL (CAAX protease family)